jgi:hypothetical protein
MDDATLHVLLPFVGVVFSAGGFYVYVKLSLKQVRTDINNIGRKVGDAEQNALRRHHNVSLVLMLAAPPSKEHEICELLKEG